jgi:tetratricopeptide (TPR) repeat protein
MMLPAYHLLASGRSRWKLTIQRALPAILGVLLPILPVTVRNAVVADDFVPISTQGGVNFYLGNHPDADGISVEMPALGPITPGGRYEDNVWTSSEQIAEYELGRDLKQSEVSSYWFDRGFDAILADPIRAVGLLAKKFYLMWHGQEIFNNKSPYYAGEYSWLMRVLLWRYGLSFPSGLLFPLMFAGIYLAISQRRKVFIPVSALLIFALTVSAFFVCSRFRQPLLPIAAIFAAYAVFETIRHFRQGRRQTAVKAVSLAVILIVALNLGGNIESKLNLSQHHNVIGNMHFANGQFLQAAEQFEKALEVSPENAQTYGSLGAAYGKAGRLADAERVLKQGLEHHPRSPEFHFNLGLVYKQSNRNQMAINHFRSAIKYDPAREMPYLGLAAIFEETGQLDSARAVYRRLLDQRPDSWKARQKLDELAE